MSQERRPKVNPNPAELGESYFCGEATEVEAYKCEEDSNFVTTCACPDDLCNVNRNAGGKLGGVVSNWVIVLLVTAVAMNHLE